MNTSVSRRNSSRLAARCSIITGGRWLWQWPNIATQSRSSSQTDGSRHPVRCAVVNSTNRGPVPPTSTGRLSVGRKAVRGFSKRIVRCSARVKSWTWFVAGWQTPARLHQLLPVQTPKLVSLPRPFESAVIRLSESSSAHRIAVACFRWWPLARPCPNKPAWQRSQRTY
jgi:hypothetical protein